MIVKLAKLRIWLRNMMIVSVLRFLRVCFRKAPNKERKAAMTVTKIKACRRYGLFSVKIWPNVVQRSDSPAVMAPNRTRMSPPARQMIGQDV